MSKTILASKFQEWKALDRISPVVHEMKCIFREITKDDFGIDGEIEIVVPKPDKKGFQTTGGIIKMQAKSGLSYVKQDSESSFAMPVDKNDLELWYNANVPIILIVYHPNDDKLYWKDIRSYVKTTHDVWLQPLKIIFNKDTDEFSIDCYENLCKLADISPPRVSFEGNERLFSNLFRIKLLPSVWSALTIEQSHERIWQEIQKARGFIPPFTIIEKRIYSLSDLNENSCILRSYCDTSDIRTEQMEYFWQDTDLRRQYVYLLNRLMNIHLYRLRIDYNKEFGRYYFPRENEESLEFKRTWTNIRTKSNPQRTIVKLYEYGYDRFWRHKAVDLTFRMIGKSWYLQIVPKYLFTEDGKIPYDNSKVGSLTTKIKAVETNMNVLNDVLFWADVLSSGDMDTIEIQLDFKAAMIIEKLPFFGITNISIPLDSITYEEQEIDIQLVFDLFREYDEDDDGN